MAKNARYLYEEELKNIVLGANLFGGGGGGCREEGEALIEEMKKKLKPGQELKVELVDLNDMEEDENVVSTMVAALGSPTATKGKTFIDEAINSVDGMIEEARMHGKNLKYIYSGEQGGGNTMLPIYVAFHKDMPLLDLDGNGRAVPAMDTGLQPIYKVPTSPVILGSEKGDTIVGRTKDPLDCKACEQIARYMCQAYNQGIGFAAWMMNKQQHKNSAINQLTWSEEAGRICREEKAEIALDKLGVTFSRRNNFKYFCTHGTITDIQMDVSGGFDRGFTTVEGDHGETFKILFQNENLVLYEMRGKEEAALATVPGIISLIDVHTPDGHIAPISNTETRVGQKVAIVYMDAAPSWYGVPEGYGCWEETLISAGYCDVRRMVKPNHE